MIDKHTAQVTYLTGLVGSTSIILASLISGLAYTGTDGQPYSPLNHFVSELGQVSVSQLAAVFNIGLILGGGLIVVYMVGLAQLMRGPLRYIFGLIGIVAGISGVLVGVFPMDQLALHSFVATIFFNTCWIAVALFCAYLLLTKPPLVSRWVLIPGLITVISSILFLREIFTIRSLAAPSERPAFFAATVFEWLVVIGVLVWTFSVAWVLRRHTLRAV